jgi:arylsulfatase A-like enzyme
MGLVNLGWNMPDSNTSDAQRFSRAGYSTYLVGGQHEKTSTADLGFQHVLADHAWSGGELFEVAHTVERLLLDLGKERARRLQPFYMRIQTAAAHRNRNPGASVIPEDGEIDLEALYAYQWSHDEGIPESRVEIFPQWLDTSILRHDLNGFTGEMKRLDRAVGIIVDALRKAGLDDETVLVYVPDHGIDFPRGKSTLYDLGIKTACIFRVPGRSRGNVVSGLSSHIDVLPTLLEMCGIDDDLDGIQGVSLVDLIDSEKTAVHDEIFAEETTFPKNRMRCIRTDRLKLIRNIDTGRKSNAGICGPYPIQGSGEHYFVDRPTIELYDLDEDRHELTNLAGQAEFRSIEAELDTRLQLWMKETNDPVLTGTLSRPPNEGDFRRGLPKSEHRDLLWD